MSVCACEGGFGGASAVKGNLMKHYLAIDIGASSGRHIVGSVEGGELRTDEVYRFPNGMDNVDGHLVWDVERLFAEIKRGIAKALEKYEAIESLSIDTWGVDYVLLRGNEELLPVYAYRDARMDAVIDRVHAIVPEAELYRRTGISFEKFNTVYQLYADKEAGRLAGVTDFLMLPEYFMYRLTGVKMKEYADATTTSLVNAETHELDVQLFRALGFPECLAKPLSMPGTTVGTLKPEIAAEVGGNLKVVLCATHDTASAVEAIDMSENAPYISSGTWSLLGVKTEGALTDEKSRTSGYSNEGGVGYNRYQKNITGMWLVNTLRRELCPDMPFGDIAEAASRSTYSEFFDPNDAAFSAPESMKRAIDEYFEARGKRPPSETADYFNAVYLSLANGYRTAIEDMEANTGKTYPAIYIVGGGAKNGYLNALTERITGKRVIALPIEATAIGNLKAQMRADHAV